MKTTTEKPKAKGDCSPASCSALHDHAVELWDMATKASIRSFNQEWSDKRLEAETVRFKKRLGEIISQNGGAVEPQEQS